MSTDNFWKFFFEIYEDLPRQGPGTRECTLRALGCLPTLGCEHRILDIGCGTGTQTLDLAGATEAQIVAVDTHEPFLDELRRRAEAAGFADRIDVQVGDMGALPFSDGSFEAVWCEGAIFILGFANGLRTWKPLLKPGGYLVVSEFCWFTDDPAPELHEMFLGDGGAPDGTEARRAAALAEGYHVVEEFVLPREGWRDNYHAPLAARLDRFEAEHDGNPEALGVSGHCRREIELYGKYPGSYGYVFFVLQRADDA